MKHDASQPTQDEIAYARAFLDESVAGVLHEVFDPIIKDFAQYVARWVKKKHPTKAMRIAHAQRSRFHRKRPRF